MPCFRCSVTGPSEATTSTKTSLSLADARSIRMTSGSRVAISSLICRTCASLSSLNLLTGAVANPDYSGLARKRLENSSMTALVILGLSPAGSNVDPPCGWLTTTPSSSIDPARAARALAAPVK